MTFVQISRSFKLCGGIFVFAVANAALVKDADMSRHLYCFCKIILSFLLFFLLLLLQPLCSDQFRQVSPLRLLWLELWNLAATQSTYQLKNCPLLVRVCWATGPPWATKVKNGVTFKFRFNLHSWSEFKSQSSETRQKCSPPKTIRNK